MNEAQFHSLIGDFCREVGIDDAETVIRSSHVEVDGMVVGLIPDAVEDERLSVYIDLGPIYDNAKLREEMLVANMEQRGDIAGCYGLHPTSGNAAFHMSFPLPLSGASLAERLRGAIDNVAEQFVTMQTR